VNRLLAAEGKPTANHKRVFRIMKRQGLLLQRHSGRRKGRLHDGKVVVMRSNLRWCSDVFEITCWNGDIVRIVFVIDAHDREVLAWHAAAGTGISGSMVRDLMLKAVELRFGTVQAPHAVEWLSDNGSPFTARETLDFAAALGLVPCFTNASGEGHRADRFWMGRPMIVKQRRRRRFAGASSRAGVRECVWRSDLASGPARRRARPADRHR
jgi:putative transposase